MIRSPLFRCLLWVMSLFLLTACGGGGGSSDTPEPPPPPPPPVSYTIASNADPAEGGEVRGAGVYQSGEDFTLTAVPAPGYVFDRWVEDDEELESSASVELFGTADRDRTIVAGFVPATLELSPDDLTLNIGDSAALSATLVAEGREPLDVSDVASWFSGNNGVATVNDNGTVTAIAEGTASITAEFGGQLTSVGVRVLPDEIISLSFEPAAVSLAIADTYTPTLIAEYQSGERIAVAGGRAAWSSSSGTVEVSTDGVLTAASAGDAVVTATIGGLDANLNVNVAAAILQAVEIDSPVADGSEIFVGAQLQFVARGQYSDGETRDLTDRVTWASTDPDVLTIESGGANAGRATAVGIDSASVSASFEGITSVAVRLQVTQGPSAAASVSLLVADDVIRWPGEGEALNRTLQARVLNVFGESPTSEQELVFSIVSGPMTFAGGTTEQTVTTENGEAAVITTATGPGEAVVRVRVADTSLAAQAPLFVAESIDQVLIGSRTETTVEVDGEERLRIGFRLLNQSRLTVPVIELRIRVPGSSEVAIPAGDGTTSNTLPFDAVPGRSIVSQGIRFDPGTEGIEATYTVEDPQTGQQFDIQL